MKRLIAIALSGGIDSLVAGYLLKEKGYQVLGIHFITGYESEALEQNNGLLSLNPDEARSSSLKERARNNISHITRQLGIQAEIIDCSREFKNRVVDYFIRTYQAGRTPNPCLVCNPSIKFGTVLAQVRKLGASTLATGHYTRIIRDRNGRFRLLKGADQEKDQSYFLALMTREQLASASFPLGTMTKSEVQKLARTKGLVPLLKKPSQDICFIKNNTYREFLARQPGFEPKPGIIEDINGNILGEHQGLHLFTIGQRRGINCPASEPYYVVRIDMKQNRLVVGFKKDLLSSECKVVNINWIDRVPTSPLKVHTRVRYRSQAVPSTLLPLDRHTALVRFEHPQFAVTPGQGGVFYRDNEVLGGGWIDK